MNNEPFKLFLIGLMGGLTIGATLSVIVTRPQPRDTVVEVRTEPRVMWANFKSDNSSKGDTYLILMDGDTLAIGEFDGYQWK